MNSRCDCGRFAVWHCDVCDESICAKCAAIDYPPPPDPRPVICQHCENEKGKNK